MPTPIAPTITLSPAVRSQLEHLLRASSTSQALVWRIRIVLEAATGKTNQEIARHLGRSRTTVSQWRSRWQKATARLEAARDDEKALFRLIEQTLSDQARSGAPVTFTAEAVTQIIALACQAPEHFEREVTHWTPTELADEVIKQGIVERISVRTVGRFLKRSRFETTPLEELAQSRD